MHLRYMGDHVLQQGDILHAAAPGPASTWKVGSVPCALSMLSPCPSLL